MSASDINEMLRIMHMIHRKANQVLSYLCRNQSKRFLEEYLQSDTFFGSDGTRQYMSFHQSLLHNNDKRESEFKDESKSEGKM